MSLMQEPKNPVFELVSAILTEASCLGFSMAIFMREAALSGIVDLERQGVISFGVQFHICNGCPVVDNDWVDLTFLQYILEIFHPEKQVLQYQTFAVHSSCQNARFPTLIMLSSGN